MAVNSKPLLVMQLLLSILVATTKTQLISKPDCTTECGNVTIPFPFGMTKECSLDTSFLINCSNQTSSPQTPFLNNNRSVEVLNISLDGKMRISLPVATKCYNSKISDYTNGNPLMFDLTPFHFSPMQNKLTVVGMDAYGVLVPKSIISEGHNYSASICLSLYYEDLINSGSCFGVGCCETTITQGISNFYYHTSTDMTYGGYYQDLHETYRCGYTFVVEERAYNFSVGDLDKFNKTEFPVVLDWAVGNHSTCKEAQKNTSTYACVSDHSECVDAKEGGGYLCNCSFGYRGNPYLPHGCQDVDDTCKNIPGACPKGSKGDGKINGTSYSPKSNISFKTFTTLITALSVSVSISALFVGSFYVCLTLKKRKFIKLKEKYFQQNGGLLLQQQISKHRGSTERSKVFSIEELKKATNNFDEGKVLGQGGQGTVYKGELLDNRTVAIKKSKISYSNRIKQFVNEVIVLSQINHRNVVKLLGCCLETEVPLLVYEFIPNGTVYEHLHNPNRFTKLTWKTRLRIATEVAGALAYLHSAASMPIIHRDVKSTNILLDHNLTAKVSDFGASRIVPLDQTQLTTLVQGTLGYLDPEYLYTSQLTEKSDVYSFGVVLAELLTGKKAISFDRSESDRNLSMYFVSSVEKGQLLQIVDNHIIVEVNVVQLMEVADIVKWCLRVKVEERPTMKVVAMELEKLRSEENHQHEGVNLSSDETTNMIKSTPTVFSVEDGPGGGGISSSFNILNQISLSFGDGR